jgi:hypothetical protein
MTAKLVGGSVLAVIGYFTVKLVFGLLGIVFSFVAFLLFTVLPIVVIGWLVMKVVRALQEKPA